MATIEDVARVSGISRSTVFRFLNGSQVRPAAREAIQAAMRELNYFFDPKASRTDILLIVSIKEHFEGITVQADMVSGIMNRAAALGLHVKLHAGGSSFLEDGLLGPGGARRTGVIFVGKSDEEEDAQSAELGRIGVRHLFVNRVFDDSSRSFVGVDLRAAAVEAVDYLLSLGYRDIGTWGCPSKYRIDREKLAGFREAFARRGLPEGGRCFTFEEDGDLELVARRLLDASRFPRAWFGLSDSHLMRLGAVLRERGLRVPEDVALCGMDDQESSKYFSPPLSTVRIPFRQAGSAAVDLLLGLIENPYEESVHMYLKHELVIRDSCGGEKAAIHG
jgi:DNA-binding LacI/PurR family transcriptional regulator